MVGVKLRVATISARPVQVKAIEAEYLLAWGTTMHLHGGLLHALVAANVEPV